MGTDAITNGDVKSAPDGKWISGLTRQLPMQQAALRTLRARLQVVQHYFPLAATQPQKNVEYVHQLRVGTRRARAALELCAPVLAEDTNDRMRRALRRMRRSAGQARDADVQLAALAEHLAQAGRKERLGLHALAGRWCYSRELAQQALRATFDEDGAAWTRLMRRCLRALRTPVGAEDRLTVADVATPHLLALIDALEAMTDVEAQDLEGLHQARIVGKQLRYAIEIFASAYPEALREELYPKVEAMQEALGNLNDAHVAATEIQAAMVAWESMHPTYYKPWRAGLMGYLRLQEARLAQFLTEFRAFWQSWQAEAIGSQLKAILR